MEKIRGEEGGKYKWGRIEGEREKSCGRRWIRIVRRGKREKKEEKTKGRRGEEGEEKMRRYEIVER